MKHNDSKNAKKKNFLRIPAFPGGREAYMKFIQDNVVYPEQALANKVEGFVYVRYTVNNIGEIVDVEVTKGIGFGCDEEAIRVIRLMKYEPANNRGIKMKVEMKTRILFHLPVPKQIIDQSDVQLNYSQAIPEKANNPEPKPREIYNYTIKF